MAEAPLYVVDASAILKWTFQSESGSQEAVDLITDYVAGRVNLVGPHQLLYEVATAIRRKILDGAVTPRNARDSLIDFLALRISTENPDGLIITAYDYCFRYPISLYDSLYVALAQIHHCSLITDDERLLRAVGSRLPGILWIEDYTSSRLGP